MDQFSGPDAALASGPTVPAGAPVAAQLTRRQKAAIIVRFLIAEGANLSLADLPEDLQDTLTRQLGQMGSVDRATVALVIEEFVQELDAIGLSFPRGLDGALSILGDKLSPTAARRLRKKAGPPKHGDPWPRVAEAPPEQLLAVLSTESREVAAVILSKLPTDLAAKLLGQMPGADARRLTYAVSRTEKTAPDVVRTIGFALAAQLDARPSRAFDDAPPDRVGAILNVSPSATRDALLDGLEEEDADFAAAVRRKIFTFPNIPARVAAGDVAKIVREADRGALVTAIAGATGDEDKAAAEFILANMSQRLSGQIREEAEEIGTVSDEDVEVAMGAIVAVIRDLETAGEIKLTV